MSVAPDIQHRPLRRLVAACIVACFWEGLDGIWQAWTGYDFIMNYPLNSGRLTGSLGDYLTSDGSTMSYRTRIRTPSYAHLQQIPAAIRGSLVSDLIVYLGSIDFVMSDVDR